MLSTQHRAIVKATVPLLESAGEVLTTHFYQRLFEEYPQVKPLFNQAHQANAAQPRALANGVLMYAKNIDQLEALGGLVNTIINKHVALQILPEHYPMVGASLLRSIEAVLGKEVAIVEVLEAWGAAYAQLAEILMGAEEQLYQNKQAAPGGWRGGRAFVLARREVESGEITSFYFSPVDGLAVLDALPGQYIGLRLLIEGQEHRRNYSLSAATGNGQYRISVKCEPRGIVSNYLHQQMQVGDTLELFTPSGELTLPDSARPLVLISGGVGITPTLAMLQAALPTGRAVYFIHCARSAAVHGFRNDIDELARQYPRLRRFYLYAEDVGSGPAPDAIGRLDKAQLAKWLPDERDIDACFVGPKGFMGMVHRALLDLGVPAAQCHYEFFGPASALD